MKEHATFSVNHGEPVMIFSKYITAIEKSGIHTIIRTVNDSFKVNSPYHEVIEAFEIDVEI